MDLLEYDEIFIIKIMHSIIFVFFIIQHDQLQLVFIIILVIFYHLSYSFIQVHVVISMLTNNKYKITFLGYIFPPVNYCPNILIEYPNIFGFA
jgi:hypothetical protein